MRFHDLRHTCASLLLAPGVPPRVVMDVLGHSQSSITMDLYSHLMPSAFRMLRRRLIGRSDRLTDRVLLSTSPSWRLRGSSRSSRKCSDQVR
ncbi:tyrosine-type recombinase/integrase [Microlunatus panaciterrae]|uniref:tyrosine-type recombinase/integrase n=1 Tax=Microlunatus panaciterrae TaxID=400768 RepID=UPI00195CE00C